MKTKLLQILTFMLLFISSLEADIFIQEATYTMGDTDSKLTAKNKVISIAKREVIEKAGVNITSYSKINKGVLKDDTIENFSSSIIKTDILEERYTFGQYYIKIKADINIELLNKRLKQFTQSGANVDDQIEMSRDEISDLNKKLNNILKQKEKKQELRNLQEKKKTLLKRVNKLAHNKSIGLKIIKDKNYGYITVTSNLKDAEIYIDGRYVGFAPIKRFKVPSGKDIELKAVADKRYYPDDEIKTINIKRLTRPKYNLELKKGFSEIFFVGENGKLFVNNDYIKELKENDSIAKVPSGAKIDIAIMDNNGNVFLSTKDLYANNLYEIEYDMLPNKAYFKKLSKTFYIEPKMVKIKSGSFIMGSNNGDGDEKPEHRVNIDYEFYIGKYEVTFKEYDKFCEDTGRLKPDDEGWGRGNKPVMNVSWNDAKAYVKWLSNKTNKNYRLPTEAEWEYVARAGTTTKYSFGDNSNELSSYAWYSSNKTHKVGTKQPNPWGVYDMHGNVWEWCEDCKTSYDETPSDGTAYNNKEYYDKVLRGGSWGDIADNLRSAYRSWNSADYTYFNSGFRLVLSD